MDYLYSLKEITIVWWFDIAFVEVMSNFWYSLQGTNAHDLQSRTKNAQSRKAAQSPEVLGPPGLLDQTCPLALHGGDEMSKCFLPHRDGKGMTSSNS